MENISKIKLYYLTNNGCEWLEEEKKITSQNFENVILSYYKENQPISENLVSKWRINGEESINMFLEVDNINCPLDLYLEIVELIDKI